MANDVFANGREIACKKASGKSICAFPDVCWTPPDKVPPTPTGVPVPYPNTGLAKDCSGGSKDVVITGKEVMLKNKSFFKKSMGDEAGVAQLKGFMTMKNRGKVYFQMWSMDVKIQAKNVVRHLDIGTHNCGSAGNTLPWAYFDTGVFDSTKVCKKDRKRERSACSEFEPAGDRDACAEAGLGSASDPKGMGISELVPIPRKHATAKPKLVERRNAKDADRCLSARRCRLQPYKDTVRGKSGCCPAQTGNHIIPSSYFKGNNKYISNDAPTMCVTGSSWHSGNHQYMHTVQSVLDGQTANAAGNSGKLTVRQAAINGARTVSMCFPESGCSKRCIAAQLEAGHSNMDGIDSHTKVKYKSIAESDKYKDRVLEEVREKIEFYRKR